MRSEQTILLAKETPVKLPARIQHLSTTIASKFNQQFYWKPKAHQPVNNCPDAIKVRNIAPQQELKSILLKLRGGLLLFHLRGHEEIDTKKVNQLHRSLFGNKTKIRLASAVELSAFNAIKGTVNPLLTEFWVLPHIVSPTVFKEEFVWTNDGELDGYVKFSPKLLLEARTIHLVDFIIGNEDQHKGNHLSLGVVER